MALNRGLVVVAVAAVLGVLPAAWAQPGGGGPPPAKVVLDEVTLEEINQWREVTGELRAARRSLLAAQEEGLVVEMGFEAGDLVKAGEVVARLDDAMARIEVDRATAAVNVRRAEVAEQRAALEQAERNLSRYEESFQRASASRQELDDAGTTAAATRARMERAEADLATAQAELARAQKRLADMTIASPFEGRVVRKLTESGQWLGVGDGIVEVVALDWIDAWLDVPEFLVPGVSEPGARVQIRVGSLAGQSGGREPEMREAEVTAVVPFADRLSRLFPVRVRMDNRVGDATEGTGEVGWNGRLKPGMSVVGLVPAGERRPTLTVHKDAILRNDVGAFVYMDAGGVGAVARVEVLFALEGGRRLAVRSDQLRAGTRVVIEGNERMFPGQPLLVLGGGGGEGGGAGGAGESEQGG